MALLTEVTPSVTQSLGEGRAVASLSLARGYLDSTNSNLLDDLQISLDKLDAEYEMKLREALSSSDAAHQALNTLARESRATLQDALRVLEDKVIMADTLDLAWGDLYKEITVLVDKTHLLNTQVVQYLNEQLAERLVSYRLQMILLIRGCVFLLIGYLYSAFICPRVPL